MSLQTKIRQAYNKTPCAKVDALAKEIRKWERRHTIASNKLERLRAIQDALCDELAKAIVAQDVKISELMERCGETDDPGETPEGYQRLDVTIMPQALQDLQDSIEEERG